ncbi:MAG: isochorismate synthase [Bacillota bacterium]|uniref:isochorismate synthase n=1 Tax=Virgibacillus sp. AGTR TaxID=2812055 RepID=UPI001962EE14|nr:isochorismate synthase [Virgibacillus sp. AGTR]MCC2249450.1 isochorismate synthase [Virgibacillus sp. AGTR]QRZ17817.1 isochorismate synthase [Virgibacillus sp. AGTR]
MIEVQDKQLEEILEDAISSLSINKVQLVSITKKIQPKNPVCFFEAARQIEKDRVFWTSTNDAFSIAGVGNAYDISANENRFQHMELKWKQVIDQAIIHNSFDVPGTGLVSLGGMDFDPKKDRTELWGDFPAIQFTVPEYMLTKYKENYYFTINVLAKKTDHPIQLANQLRDTERFLLTPIKAEKEKLRMLTTKVIAPEEWKKTVKKATEEIRHTSIDKIVLAREMRVKLNKNANIATILDQLLATQSNSFVFAFERNNNCFIGATPERLVKIENKQLLSTCLAGTAPRGKSETEDRQISNQLFHDEKNREEHDFVVQMIKKGLNKYCVNVHVPEEPTVYPLKNLQHLYTPVTGKLKAGYSIFDIVEQLHPTPALGGVPRNDAITFIRDYELLDRGWYGAPVGWLDSNDNGEFAVAIRSALIQNDEASLFAGCGVVKDSIPEAEFEETRIKFTPMLSVLGGES